MSDQRIGSLRDSLKQICLENEVVLIDTSCCRGDYRSDLSRQQIREIRSVVGRRFAVVPHHEEVLYLNMLINLVYGNNNIRTVRDVIAEMEGGFRHFRHRTSQQDPYRSAATGLMTKLKDRVIEFSGEEARNFTLLREGIWKSRKLAGKYMREKDMSLAAASATSAAYRGNTAVLSNDTDVLGTILSVPVEIEKIPGVMRLRFSLVPYSSMESDTFYPCKASGQGLKDHAYRIPA